MSPLFPHQKPGKAMVTPFGTDWGSVKSDTWGEAQGRESEVRAEHRSSHKEKDVKRMPKETRRLL